MRIVNRDDNSKPEELWGMIKGLRRAGGRCSSSDDCYGKDLFRKIDEEDNYFCQKNGGERFGTCTSC